ncbi:MAG: electron transport complex protein RnfE [Paracoccaceae bacterium]|jgi:electron transport complex protein RnfE
MSIAHYTKDNTNSLLAPIWIRSPVLTQLLGLSPLLAISTTATKGMVLGLISAVICLSAVTVDKALHSRIRPAWRYVWYLFLTSSLTTGIDLVLQLTRLPLHGQLGLYLPLLACNFAILIHLETSNNKRNDATSSYRFGSSLSYCFGIILALTLFSSFRELVVFGSIFRDWSLLTSAANSSIENAVYANSEQLIPFASLQPGAFVLLGLFLAAKKMIDNRFNLRNKKIPTRIKKVERARVTGKL